MILSDRQDLTPDDIRLLDPMKVAEYLRNRGWRVSSPPAARGLVQLFDRPESRTRPVQVRIPISSKLADYDDVMLRTLSVLAEFEGSARRAVFENLLHYSDDVISVREDTSDSRSGSVSFPRVLTLLSGLKRALLSAAHLEIEPLPHYPRLDRADAELLLDRCRFGQTRRGSFVMTVACPLNAVPEGANPDQLSFLPSFGRRVTMRLMGSIRLLVEAAVRDDDTSLPRTDDTETMISANLCDALAELAPSEPAGRLDVSCQWAKKKPLDNEAESPTTCTIRAEHVPFILSFANVLRTARHPETRQEFYGRIDTLNGRPDADGRMAGPVYSRMTDPNNDTIKVRIDLDADQYKVAVEAHGSCKMVMVFGLLRRSPGGGLRIEDHGGLHLVSTRAN